VRDPERSAQILYLASRNLTLHLRPGLMGFQFHQDEFFSGSGGGNCGIPGNQNCVTEHPLHRELFLLRLGKLEIRSDPDPYRVRLGRRSRALSVRHAP